MYVIFIDECGYQPNWSDEKTINEQPVHVVSAVAIDSGELGSIYKNIYDNISALALPVTDYHTLGKGYEIKAKKVDKGDEFWGRYPDLRNRVREIYLNYPKKTVYFVACVDKFLHKGKYVDPEDPSNLALRFTLERIQGFLNECREYGIVLIDANKLKETEHREFLADLLQRGSEGVAVSKLCGRSYEWRLKMTRILEIHFGDSKYSLGLQIADFVARHTYSWWKSGKQHSYPGWSFIEPKLWKYPKHNGWGYKEFP